MDEFLLDDSRGKKVYKQAAWNKIADLEEFSADVTKATEGKPPGPFKGPTRKSGYLPHGLKSSCPKLSPACVARVPIINQTNPQAWALNYVAWLKMTEPNANLLLDAPPDSQTPGPH